MKFKHGWFLALLAVAALTLPARAAQPAIEYDTAAGKVLFCVDTRGGVASSLQELTSVPEFTLFGDGTALWTRYDKKKDLREVWCAQLAADEVHKEIEWLMSLGFADWYDRYDQANLPNLPTTTFTLSLKDQSLKRQVYGLQLATKRKLIPDGFGQIYDHFSAFKHPTEAIYKFDRIMVYARKMTKLEAKRGFKTLNWGVSQVKLADFARESETEYGQLQVSGKDALRVLHRLKDWTLFSTDLSVVFFKEKKENYQIGYRPLLPNE